MTPSPTMAQINAEAAAWIEQRDRDGWTAENETALASWLAQSPAHRAAFWRLEAAWKDTSRLGAFRAPQRRTHREGFTAPIFKAVAALAVIALCTAAGLQYLSMPEGKTYSTTVGGRQILTLSDGSKIDLNTDSAVRVALSETTRKVWLEKGEAYFEVTHDSSRPFVVTVGNRQITDLGTKFQIRQDANHLRVAVLEGRVQIDEKKTGAKPLVLDAGDVAVATGNAIHLARRDTKELEKDLGWQRGVLVFDNRTLGDVTAEFNRYNSRKMVITDRATAATRIAGTFRADNVDAFVNTLERVLGLHITHHGSDIAIAH